MILFGLNKYYMTPCSYDCYTDYAFSNYQLKIYISIRLSCLKAVSYLGMLLNSVVHFVLLQKNDVSGENNLFSKFPGYKKIHRKYKKIHISTFP